MPKTSSLQEAARIERMRWGLMKRPGHGEVEAVKALQSAGYLTYRQTYICGYYVDIGIPSAMIAVEVDSPSKRVGPRGKRREQVRQARIEAAGWKVVRVPNFAPHTAVELVKKADGTWYNDSRKVTP
jgi:very-short-patch-repair endonuclease